MPSYLVDAYLPRSRADELSDLISRLRAAAEALTEEGTQVRHVRSSFLPADELFLHLMEAESAEAAGEASRRAGARAYPRSESSRRCPSSDDPRRSAQHEQSQTLIGLIACASIAAGCGDDDDASKSGKDEAKFKFRRC